MPKFVMVATSGALAGREDEYNAWYDETHVHDILAIPGVQSARRFDAVPQSPNAPPAPYLAIYEIEADDISAVIAELGRRAMAGEIRRGEALDRSAAQVWFYQQR